VGFKKVLNFTNLVKSHSFTGYKIDFFAICRRANILDFEFVHVCNYIIALIVCSIVGTLTNTSDIRNANANHQDNRYTDAPQNTLDHSYYLILHCRIYHILLKSANSLEKSIVIAICLTPYFLMSASKKQGFIPASSLFYWYCPSQHRLFHIGLFEPIFLVLLVSFPIGLYS